MKPNNSSATNSNALSILADRLAAQRQLDRWRADPVLWVTEALGETLWSRQAEIMRTVAEHPRTVVRSAHGVGKSFLASRIIAHYLCCHDPGDYFCVVTAPSWQQIRGVVWRYLGQLHAKHNLPGFVGQDCTWKIGNELVALGRKPADHDHHGMQGLHARKGVIAIGDEGCGLPDQLWNSLDALTTTPASRTLIIGNPDSTNSRFHRVATGAEPGWHSLKISAYDSPSFTGEHVTDDMRTGLVSQEWVADKAERWGRDSALFKIKVMAEFADDHAQTVIPADWIRQAQLRWRDWHDRDDVRSGHREPAGPPVFGVDVGHMGTDQTVIATTQGAIVQKVEAWSKLDTVAVANLVEARLDASVQGLAIIDAIGVGAGVLDILRDRRKNVRPFIASAATTSRDNSGTQRFQNLRAAAWWHARECLDPARNPSLALPADDDLLHDLSAPRWETAPGARIKIESKDDIRKRLGRSPDRADAVISAIWANHPTAASISDDPWTNQQRLHPVAYQVAEQFTGRWGQAVFTAEDFGLPAQ